jgi:ssDNA-binding Zn-finger/Zn-ribbon topoisomerase 1
VNQPDEPIPPSVLAEPCPKCGGQVLIRHWEGRFYTKCKGEGCFFGYDADEQGSAVQFCGHCATGRMKNTPKGKVCADCGKWEQPTVEAEGASLGACPKCNSGRLSVRKGQFGPFVSCSNRACGLTFNSDEAGKPLGGTCRKCKGPVKKTRTGSLVCAVCETWQDSKGPGPAEARPPQPPAAKCPGCRQTLRAVWTKRNRWAYRCDPCDRWIDS